MDIVVKRIVVNLRKVRINDMGLMLITDMSRQNDKPTKVYRKDKVSSAGNNYSTFSTKVSSKNDKDEWESAFIELVFKKDDQSKITNKCDIVIKSSFPILNTYNDRTTIRWMVMDFDVVSEGEKANNDFVNIPEGIADELPFA